MANSTKIIDYIGYGTAASRPATPPVASGILALWYSTDTLELDGWTGAAWVSLSAGVNTAGNGIKINSGTISAVNSVTLVGTAAGTLTIAPGSGTSDVVITMPASGGTVTLAAAPAFQFQRAVIHVNQGATAGAVVLNAGFVNPTSGGPGTYTASATASVHDMLGIYSRDGIHWVVDGILNGVP